jgi:hypothetical protein
MLLYKVASFVVIDFENGVDYISFSVFDFSALKNGTEYSFVNDQFQVNDYTDVTLIKDKSGTVYTEATLDAFIATIKVISDPSGDGFVPYTGAISDVNLGEYGLSGNWLQIDTTPTTYVPAVGRIGWNDSDGTLEFKLKGDNVTLQIGQEQVSRVVNKTDPLIDLLEANYQVVKITGAQGNRLKVALAQANNDANSAETLGIVTETILKNEEGFITTSGLVRGVNTTGSIQGETWADGDMLYLSGTVAGRITKVKPSAPIHTVIIGYVVRAHATQGQIYVKIDNGYELEELHNVKITAPANKQSLFYNESTSIWENRLIGISDVTDLQTELNGKIDGTGTLNFIPKFTASGTIGDSLIYDNGTNIGIGTTNPARALHIKSSANEQLVLDSTSNIAGIFLNPANTTFSPFYGATGNDHIWKTDGSEKMRLTAAGNIGIGTLSPSHKLDVNGSFQTTGDAYFNGTNFYLNSSFSFIGNDATDLVSIGGNTIYLSGNGNVGIGTTTAGYRLSVFTGSLSNQSLNISDGTGNITIGHWDGSNNRIELYGKETYFIQYGASYSMKFGVNGNEVLRLTPDGYAGFGTTNPFQKIHLYGGNLLVENGNIETTGSFALAQQFYDSTFSAGNPNQVLTSNSVGTIWSDLKTVNGNSLVGSGDISIASNGLKGIHSLIPLKSGDVTNTVMISVNPLSSTNFTTNRLVAYPFIPNQNFTSSDLFINVNTLAAGSFCRIAVYSDLNGYPNTLLFVSSDLNCSTTGKKTALATINFVAGTTYWLAFHGGAVASSLSCILQAQSMPIKSNTVASMANSYFYALAFTTPTPATFLANQSAISQNLQYIGITKA